MDEIPIACIVCGNHEHKVLDGTIMLMGQEGKTPIKAKKQCCVKCGAVRVVRD